MTCGYSPAVRDIRDITQRQYVADVGCRMSGRLLDEFEGCIVSWRARYFPEPRGRDHGLGWFIRQRLKGAGEFQPVKYISVVRGAGDI